MTRDTEPTLHGMSLTIIGLEFTSEPHDQNAK